MENFFRKVGGNFLRVRKGEISVDFFDVSAREGFDPNFFDVRKERFDPNFLRLRKRGF